jgi:hypothetical protein
MNQSEHPDIPTAAGKPTGPSKNLWRWPTIAALATAGLATTSIVLDNGTEHARDLALLIGAPTLYLLAPALAAWLVVALVIQIRRRSIGPRK